MRPKKKRCSVSLLSISNCQTLFTSHECVSNLHFRLGNTLDSPAPLAVSLAGHQDGLSASRGHDGSCIGASVEESRNHGANFGLHLSDTGEDLRMQGVGAREGSIGASREIREDLVVVVDGSRDTSLLPTGVRQFAVSVYG